MMEKIGFKEKIKSMVTNKLFLWATGYAVLFLVSGFWKYLELLLIPYLICAFIFLSIENDFYLFIITQIFYGSLYIRRPSIIAEVIYGVVLLVKFIIGLKQKKYTLHKKILIAIGIFTLYTLIISLFHHMAIYSIGYMFYLPLFYVIFETRQEYNTKKIFKLLSYSLIITSVFSLLTVILPAMKYECFATSEDITRFKAFFASPNGLYMMAMLALSGITYFYFKKEIALLEFLFLYVCLSILTIATLSKAGIIMLCLLTIIVIVLFLTRNFKKSILPIIICIVALVLFGFIFKDFVMRIFARFLHKYDSNDLNSLFTGRLDIWKDYCKAIFKNPLNCIFGHGILSKYVYCNAQGCYRAQHNLYIFLLYKFGIVGIVLLRFVIKQFIIEGIKSKPKFINFIPLIYFLILGMCDNAFMLTHFYILVAFILFNSNAQEKTIQTKKNSQTQDNKKNKKASNSNGL